MKNTLTLLLFFFFLHSAWATNYYFSAVSGDDSRTPAQAQSASTPWKTIHKLNDYFNRIQPGDSVLFKRGETFYGSIIVNKSGTAGSPIVISAFGAGNKPVITGLTTLTNWVAAGNGIYESFNPSLGYNLHMVLINDAQQPIGRYPNNGYLTLESHVGKTSIYDKELTSAPNWKGAELVLRTSHWTIERCKITSHSGSTIHYTANQGAYDASDNYGYFIQNHIKTLDQLGEWCYNPSTKKLSMFFGSNNPNSYTVKAATINRLVYSFRKSYVVFDNLTIKGANQKGADINNGSNMTIKNCDVLFSGTDGVRASGANFKLENSQVLNSNNNGVNVARATGPQVRNNNVKNTYTIAGMGQSGNGQGAGIRNGKSGIVEYNQVLNSGFVGVQLGGDYSIVRNNLIDSFCFIKDDAGGIYTSNGTDITNYGRKVTDNIVLNGIGAPAGTNTTNSSAEGIYMDDYVNGTEIVGNTMANCHRGIYFHNTRGIIFKNNTSYNNDEGQLYMKHDASGLKGLLRNHIITNNIFFSKISTQFVSSINSVKNDIDKTGRFDSNYYARPINEGIIIFNSFVNTSGKKVEESYNLDAWKSKYKYDQFSKLSAKQISAFKIKRLVGSNKFAYGSFNARTDAKVWANNCTASWENSGVLDGGYLKVIPSAKSSSLVLGVGNLSSSKKYILKYSQRGSSHMSINSYLRTSKYTPVTTAEYRTVTATRNENEVIFSPSADQTDCSLVFTVDAQSTYYLDNIQLYEAEATVTNPDDSIRFVFNATPIIKTVSLDGKYVDVKNNKYSNSIILQPFASAVLIKDGGETPNQNTAPTVSITSPAVNASYKSSATISVSADASDADGLVKKVEFYNGTTLLHTETVAPYIYSWKDVPAGNYTITAKATDNSGQVAVSESVSFAVTASSSGVSNDKSPAVNITSPQVNAVYNASSTVYMSAHATDADGSITKVEFYNGTTLLRTERYVPYTYYWHDVPAGKYTITAKATDNNGNVTTSESVSISVSASSSSEKNTAPKVNITSPVMNADYNEKATIKISADASDADGSIRKVAFYSGTTLMHTEINAPYEFPWHKVRAGNYVITAKATDNSGNVTVSESVSITVTAHKVSHRSAENKDTTVVISKDTASVIKNAYAINLKQQVAGKTEPGIYNLKVFPNPAINNIHIDVEGLQMSNQKATLSIQNLSGQMIKNIPVILSGKTIEADVTSLKAGGYIISITGNNFKISKKFIKN